MSEPVLRRAARRAFVLALACLLAPLAPARAEPAAAPAAAAADRSGWETGWYIVRPGDTLETLAHSLLGSHEHWRELAALNPGIDNPHLIYPGQRIKVYQSPPTDRPTARIEALSRRVEERPQPVPWRPAGEGDLLVEKDSLRTYLAASARLRFDDGAEITLTEDSLVFLRRQTPAKSAKPKKEIEVLVGQADLAARGAAGKPVDVEVVVGDAKSVATADDDRPLRTRSRRGPEESAQFMTYEGTAQVAAAGKSVALPAGSGVQVAKRAAPGPVEALLAAPEPAGPAAGEEVERAGASVTWQPVAGAASYVVEVCADPACGALVERASGLTASRYDLAETQREEVWWRVTAVSASGLDGFPSAPRAFKLVDSIAPATPLLALLGADGAVLASGACVGAPPQARVSAVDRAGAELPWTLRLDGAESDLAALAGLAGGMGRHQVMASVRDARGRVAVSQPVDFQLDSAAPWLNLAGGGGGPDRDERRSVARHVYPRVRDAAPTCEQVALQAILLPDGTPVAVPCGAAAEPLRFPVSGDTARIEIVPAGEALRVGEQIDVAGAERMHLTAGDVGCGLATVELRLTPSRYAPGYLALEATVADRAGNRLAGAWHVEPHAGRR